MGLLKLTLPTVGGLVAILNAALVANPKTFFENFNMAAVGKEVVESPLVLSAIFNMSAAWALLGLLGVASYFRGSETRFRIGLAMTTLLLLSIYADFAMPYEFVLDKKGRKTNVPVSNDLSSLRFVVKLALTLPLVVALLVHLCEPGLLTTDKGGKKQQ